VGSRAISIKHFYVRGRAKLSNECHANKIALRFHKRILDRLDLLEQAVVPDDMNVFGFNFHTRLGFVPTRDTIHVKGPWRLTFEFEDGDAFRVDFEQYH
jgi:proteic killer suppression protein